MIRRLFSGIAVLGVLLAFVVALVWLFEAPAKARWEPAVSVLSLAAAFTGIFAERWAGDAERRNRALEAMRDEFRSNMSALAEAGVEQPAGAGWHPRLYPRFSAQATHDALRQGAFRSEKDDDFRKLMYKWVAVCDELNHRLTLTETLVFIAPSPDRVHAFESAVHRSGGILDRAAAINAEIIEQLEKSLR
jgi:hypothetical protein